MAHINYYTKPGCITSVKQVDLLRRSGHDVQVHDLLAHPWHPEELLAYFGDLPVRLWFNPNSPRVKSGEIDPASFDSATALQLMREDHLLIRRPLMESGGHKVCGFDPAAVHDWVGLVEPEEAVSQSAFYQTCSQSPVSGEPPECP
jgi:nitrogenase-associated protein